MNPWYENLVAEMEDKHDLQCEEGSACSTRGNHVDRYLLIRMRSMLNRLMPAPEPKERVLVDIPRRTTWLREKGWDW